jgi:hypothetical protein
MALTHCPHCGAENFTMEGWEDLDHCSSCGKPLGELDRGGVDLRTSVGRYGIAGDRGILRRDGRNAEKPRPA